MAKKDVWGTATRMTIFGTHRGEAAETLFRGVSRLLIDQGCGVLVEVSLPNGRRADIVAVTSQGAVSIVEVKSGIADFRSDAKWSEYRPFCDRFYFAVGADFPLDRLPDDCGVIVADGFGGHIRREAPLEPLAPARRKAITLRFALTASRRLTGLLDPRPDGTSAT